MAKYILKSDVTKGFFEGNTKTRPFADYFLFTDRPNPKKKWPKYQFISSVPNNVPPKYWKRTNGNIREMTIGEKATADGLNKKNRIVSWGSIRANYRVDFIGRMSDYLTNKAQPLTRIEIIKVFQTIGDALNQMDRIDLESAILTIDSIDIINDFKQDVKDQMKLIIQTRITNE